MGAFSGYFKGCQAAPEFLTNGVGKLRVTRAVAARLRGNLVFSFDLLNVLVFFLSVKLVARFSYNALWGRCDSWAKQC